jgi:hypothetical protein
MTFPGESARVRCVTEGPKASDGISVADGNAQESVLMSTLPGTCDFLDTSVANTIAHEPASTSMSPKTCDFLGGKHAGLQVFEESSDTNERDVHPIVTATEMVKKCKNRKH